MSRKIKYRVWDEGKKKYCTEYNAMTLKHDGEFCIEREWCTISGGFEVEQSTLLKDKNGKEIYEGDIVKYEDCVFSIGWTDKHARFGFMPVRGCDISMGFSMKECKVIGNIHENPELLGGEE